MLRSVQLPEVVRKRGLGLLRSYTTTTSTVFQRYNASLNNSPDSFGRNRSVIVLACSAGTARGYLAFIRPISATMLPHAGPGQLAG